MDSSWSMLESDSPSPPPLPPPLGVGNSFASPPITPPTMASTTVTNPQPNIGIESQRIAPTLPPPIFAQYPPYQTPIDSRQYVAPHSTTLQPSQYNTSTNNLTTYNPYANSFQRRRQAYDSRNNGVISKIAEDKTRSAFNSIEVILDTFSSLSAILENTYSAIYGSFRTLTNVADHIIFLRNHLAELALLPRAIQILSRFLKWMLQALGFGRTNFVQQLDESMKERLLHETFGSDPSSPNPFQSPKSPSSSAWPILAFISLVFGTPYIVRKLLGAPADVIPRTNRPEWTLKNGHHYIAVGLHDFVARNTNELSFTKDCPLYIKPESMQPGSKWFIATLANDDPAFDPRQPAKAIGLVPANYVRILMK